MHLCVTICKAPHTTTLRRLVVSSSCSSFSISGKSMNTLIPSFGLRGLTGLSRFGLVSSMMDLLPNVHEILQFWLRIRFEFLCPDWSQKLFEFCSQGERLPCTS